MDDISEAAAQVCDVSKFAGVNNLRYVIREVFCELRGHLEREFEARIRIDEEKSLETLESRRQALEQRESYRQESQSSSSLELGDSSETTTAAGLDICEEEFISQPFSAAGEEALCERTLRDCKVFFAHHRYSKAIVSQAASVLRNDFQLSQFQLMERETQSITCSRLTTSEIRQFKRSRPSLRVAKGSSNLPLKSCHEPATEEASAAFSPEPRGSPGFYSVVRREIEQQKRMFNVPPAANPEDTPVPVNLKHRTIPNKVSPMEVIKSPATPEATLSVQRLIRKFEESRNTGHSANRKKPDRLPQPPKPQAPISIRPIPSRQRVQSEIASSGATRLRDMGLTPPTVVNLEDVQWMQSEKRGPAAELNWQQHDVLPIRFRGDTQESPLPPILPLKAPTILENTEGNRDRAIELPPISLAGGLRASTYPLTEAASSVASNASEQQQSAERGSIDPSSTLLQSIPDSSQNNNVKLREDQTDKISDVSSQDNKERESPENPLSDGLYNGKAEYVVGESSSDESDGSSSLSDEEIDDENIMRPSSELLTASTLREKPNGLTLTDNTFSIPSLALCSTSPGRLLMENFKRLTPRPDPLAPNQTNTMSSTGRRHRTLKPLGKKDPNNQVDISDEEAIEQLGGRLGRKVTVWAQNTEKWHALVREQLTTDPLSIFGCGVRPIEFNEIFGSAVIRRARREAPERKPGPHNLSQDDRRQKERRWENDKKLSGFPAHEGVSRKYVDRYREKVHKVVDKSDLVWDAHWVPCNENCNHDSSMRQPWYKNNGSGNENQSPFPTPYIKSPAGLIMKYMSPLPRSRAGDLPDLAEGDEEEDAPLAQRVIPPPDYMRGFFGTTGPALCSRVNLSQVNHKECSSRVDMDNCKFSTQTLKKPQQLSFASNKASSQQSQNHISQNSGGGGRVLCSKTPSRTWGLNQPSSLSQRPEDSTKRVFMPVPIKSTRDGSARDFLAKHYQSSAVSLFDKQRGK